MRGQKSFYDKSRILILIQKLFDGISSISAGLQKRQLYLRIAIVRWHAKNQIESVVSSFRSIQHSLETRLSLPLKQGNDIYFN